jgi:hypothetical protein
MNNGRAGYDDVVVTTPVSVRIIHFRNVLLCESKRQQN